MSILKEVTTSKGVDVYIQLIENERKDTYFVSINGFYVFTSERFTTAERMFVRIRDSIIN